MDGERVPEAWVGTRVLVQLRNEGGGTYSVMARLREANDEGLRLKLQASGSTQTVSWDSVAGVRPLGDRRS